MLYFLASNNNFRKIPLAIIRLRFKSAERDSVFFLSLSFFFFSFRALRFLSTRSLEGNIITWTRQQRQQQRGNGTVTTMTIEKKRKKKGGKRKKKRNTRTNVVWNYNCIQQRRRCRLSFIKQGAHWRHTTVAKLRKTWLPRKLDHTGCFKIIIGY